MRNFASIRRGLFAVLGLALTFSIAQPAAAAIIGGSVIVQNTGEVVATYRGNSAQFSNDLYLDSPDGFFRTSIIFNNHASPIGSSVSLGSFTAGTELIFHLHVNDTGNDWFTGPAARNDDCLARFCEAAPNSPEIAHALLAVQHLLRPIESLTDLCAQ